MRRAFGLLLVILALFFGRIDSADMQTDAVLFAEFREITITIIPPQSYNE